MFKFKSFRSPLNGDLFINDPASDALCRFFSGSTAGALLYKFFTGQPESRSGKLAGEFVAGHLAGKRLTRSG